MANFGQFLAKMGKTGIFFKKALGTFFSQLQVLTNCKVSEKSNEQFSSNSVTYVRTHRRTHGRESLGLQRLRRKTKIDSNLAKKGPFLNSSKKMHKHNFFRLQRLGLVQKLSKF